MTRTLSDAGDQRSRYIVTHGDIYLLVTGLSALLTLSDHTGGELVAGPHDPDFVSHRSLSLLPHLHNCQQIELTN